MTTLPYLAEAVRGDVQLPRPGPDAAIRASPVLLRGAATLGLGVVTTRLASVIPVEPT
jgi:hypothetical protein